MGELGRLNQMSVNLVNISKITSLPNCPWWDTYREWIISRHTNKCSMRIIKQAEIRFNARTQWRKISNNVHGIMKGWKTKVMNLKGSSLDTPRLLKPSCSGHMLENSFCLSKKRDKTDPIIVFATHLGKTVTSSNVSTHKKVVAMRKKEFYFEWLLYIWDTGKRLW